MRVALALCVTWWLAVTVAYVGFGGNHSWRGYREALIGVTTCGALLGGTPYGRPVLWVWATA